MVVRRSSKRVSAKKQSSKRFSLSKHSAAKLKKIAGSKKSKLKKLQEIDAVFNKAEARHYKKKRSMRK